MVAGGATTALGIWALAGLTGGLPPAIDVAVVGTLALWGIGHDFRLLTVWLPRVKRQVPEAVFYQTPRKAALQFGFELGLGFRTQAPASTPYALAFALALYSPGVWLSLIVGLSFGSARALMPVLRFLSRDTRDWDHRLKNRSRFLIRASTLLGAGALVLLGLTA
jgi:hypothetical protein